MDFTPLFEASPAIQIHAYAAIAAFFLGGAILFRRKSGPWHRLLGRTWVGLMITVAISSFFIHTIRLWGIWSPIHLIGLGTFFSLGYGVWLIRQRIVTGHQRVMQGTYFGALIIAGSLSFLPGRIMHEVFFGGPSPVAGIAALAAVGAGGAVLLVLGKRAPEPDPRLQPAPRIARG